MRMPARPASASADAPGRLELLGNHTDYNQGLVLAAAIDRKITVSGQARPDDIVTFTSTDRVEASLSDIRPRSGQERWANYPLGVIRQLQLAGYEVRGFDAEVSGDIPVGAGLGSSAALEVAMAGFIMRLHGFRLPPLDVARLCQRAENEFVGVKSGLLDQATSVFGRADQLVFLDFKTEEIRTLQFPVGFGLVIADPGVKHSLVAGEYNARRRECDAAARSLGVSSLREIDLPQLENARPSLDPRLYRRALHVLGENDRVMQAVEALRAGDAVTIGKLMNESHESSRVNFENSTPELDALTARARLLPGVLGSRLTGGGFGGGTISLVREDRTDSVVEALRGHSETVFVCRIADGAAIQWG